MWGQHVSSQDVSLWYADCFELMVTLATGSRETSASYPNDLEELELKALVIRDYKR